MTYRKLHVEGETYEYVVGGTCVNIKLPGGGTLRPPPHEVKGLSGPHIVERGQWKRTQDGMVTPGEIVDWIRVNHLGLAPVERPSIETAGPVPDAGEGSYWIRFRNVTKRVAAHWSKDGGWTLPGDGHTIPGSGIVEILGPVAVPRPDLYHVVAWRNEVDGGIRNVTIGIFTEPGPAKAAQVDALERVAAELEPILGRRPRPLEAARAAHDVGLDLVWHVEIHPLAADVVVADPIADSPYADAEATLASLGRRVMCR